MTTVGYTLKLTACIMMRWRSLASVLTRSRARTPFLVTAILEGGGLVGGGEKRGERRRGGKEGEVSGEKREVKKGIVVGKRKQRGLVVVCWVARRILQVRSVRSSLLKEKKKKKGKRGRDKTRGCGINRWCTDCHPLPAVAGFSDHPCIDSSRYFGTWQQVDAPVGHLGLAEGSQAL